MININLVFNIMKLSERMTWINKLKSGSRKRKNYIKKLLYYLIPLLFLKFISSCESHEVFYRPDLPEKLCSIGIIDIDDTTLRHISFQRSFQSEYPDEVNDSLRNFSFSISSSSCKLFGYHCDPTVKKIEDLRIPDSISFEHGEKYYLEAEEKGLEKISAEVKVPEPPSIPELLSVYKERINIPVPLGCIEDSTARAVIIDFWFNKDQKMYYALLVEGWGYTYSSALIPWPGFLDFSLKEANSPGFFAEMQGLKVYHYSCTNHQVSVVRSPAYAFFIEGGKIPEKKCLLKMFIQYSDGYSVYDGFKFIRIKLLSIPEELYLFEKSLYTHKKTSTDPFSEPVYINGNIKGGNGIFALCRSKELKITFSPWISYCSYPQDGQTD
jgi:hypothetical protein